MKLYLHIKVKYSVFSVSQYAHVYKVHMYRLLIMIFTLVTNTNFIPILLFVPENHWGMYQQSTADHPIDEKSIYYYIYKRCAF
jgi:hypothetical protein